MTSITRRIHCPGPATALATALLLSLAAALIMAAPALAGNMVSASCPCGYKAENLLIFGGRANFETFCAFPVYCPGCPTLAVADLYGSELTCPQCPGSKAVPYDDPSLMGKPGSEVVAGWNTTQRLGRALELTNGEYLCPACGKFSLKFQLTGFWD